MSLPRFCAGPWKVAGLPSQCWPDGMTVAGSRVELSPRLEPFSILDPSWRKQFSPTKQSSSMMLDLRIDPPPMTVRLPAEGLPTDDDHARDCVGQVHVVGCNHVVSDLRVLADST